MTRLRPTDGTTIARITLAVDLVALASFVIVGMRSHRTASQLEIFGRNAVPIGAAWIVASLLLRTYRPPTLTRLFLTWAVAIPVGVVLRSAWTGSPDGDDLFVFGAVAMTFTLAFLGAGRVLTALIAPRVRAEGAR
jgi:hypothetical protein